MFSKLINFLSYMPLFPITSQRGGKPVGWASWRGLNIVAFAGIVAVVVGLVFFMRWYRAHPVGGKIALWLLIIWGIWWVVRYIRALNDDPLLRAAPYRKIEIPTQDTHSTEK